MEFYEDGNWMDVEDRTKLTKLEGQVWLTLYQILLDKDCQQKYEITHHSKTLLLSVRASWTTYNYLLLRLLLLLSLLLMLGC